MPPSSDTVIEVAEALGRGLATIVNEIQSLDARRRELTGQLAGLQQQVNEQFTKYVSEPTTTLLGKVADATGLGGNADKGTQTGSRSKPCVMCTARGFDGTDHSVRNHGNWLQNQPDEVRQQFVP